MVKRRLTHKSNAVQTEAKAEAKAKAKAKVEPKVKATAKAKPLTELRSLVRCGLLPKARTSYALLLQDMAMVCDTTKDTAVAWAEAGDDVKQRYKIRAAEEANAQREAKAALGVVNRGTTKKLRFCDSHRAVEAKIIESGQKRKSVVSCMSFGNYSIDKNCALLGEGAYGTVAQAVHNDNGSVVAAKIFNGRAGVESAKREFGVYEALENNALAKAPMNFLRRIEFQSTQSTAWMVMPYIPEGSLAKHIRAHGPLNAKGVDA